MTILQHTPTPWRIEPANVVSNPYYNETICQVRGNFIVAHEPAFFPGDAAFIITACNYHDDLVAALESNQAILNSLTLCPTFTAPTELCDAIIEQAIKNRATIAKVQ